MDHAHDEELRLGHELSSVSRARHWVSTRCRALAGDAGADVGGEDLRDALQIVELIVTELVANAVEHGTPPVRAGVARTGGGPSAALRVWVADGSATSPVRRDPRAEATSGRGIALVEHLSSAWGVERCAGGKLVWCEVPLRGARLAGPGPAACSSAGDAA